MPRLTRQEKQAHTRERVLEAATLVFARRGYRAASIEEIAEQAGFSHGAVYSNFAGKEALFLAVYEERILRRQHEIATAHDAAATPEDQQRAAADQWMERLRADPEYFLLFLEFVTQAGRDDETRGAFANRAAATRSTIGRMLDELAAQRGSELAVDSDRLALAIRALGLGLAIEHVLDPRAVAPELYGDVVSLLLDCVAPASASDQGAHGRRRR